MEDGKGTMEDVILFIKQSYDLRKMNYRRILVLFLLLSATVAFSFFVIFGSEESDWGINLSDGIWSYLLVHICTGLYYVIAFPNIISIKLAIRFSDNDFFIGMFTGALIDAILIEFILNRYSLFKLRKHGHNIISKK